MSLQVEHMLAFNKLYTEYSRRFIRFARSYVQTDEEAEDIVNDSFMYYWENRATIDNSNLAAYLLTMVKHRCLNHLKRQVLEEQIKSDFHFLEEWELQLKITSLEVCNPNMLMSHEIQALVQRALAALPVQTREVLLRSRYHSQSNKEIAAALGISVKAVEYHITKALRVLRVVLKDYFPFWLLMCSYWLDEVSCWH